MILYDILTADRQTCRQADRQTGRQADRQDKSVLFCCVNKEKVNKKGALRPRFFRGRGAPFLYVALFSDDFMTRGRKHI